MATIDRRKKKLKGELTMHMYEKSGELGHSWISIEKMYILTHNAQHDPNKQRRNWRQSRGGKGHKCVCTMRP